MGKTTLARQRAIGTIGPARVAKLEEKDLLIVDRADYEKLMARRAELEQEIARLTRAVEGLEATAQELREVVGR